MPSPTQRTPFKRHKYHVAPADQRRFMGRTYDSKAERDYAADLHALLKIGAIREVVPQPSVALVEECNVRPDFLIIENDWQAYYVDVKGMETAEFKRTKRLWRVHGRLPLRVVKRKGQAFTTTEIIEPERRVNAD